jgi:hypothetical protein
MLRLASEEEPKALREIRMARVVSAAAFRSECRRIRKSCDLKASMLCSISLADIEKALEPKKKANPEELMPAEIYREFKSLFSADEADQLPPHRPGVNREVNLQRTSSGDEPPLL